MALEITSWSRTSDNKTIQDSSPKKVNSSRSIIAVHWNINFLHFYVARTSRSPGRIVTFPVEIGSHIDSLAPVHGRDDSSVSHSRHSGLEVVHDAERLRDVLEVVTGSVKDSDSLVVAGSTWNIAIVFKGDSLFQQLAVSWTQSFPEWVRHQVD